MERSLPHRDEEQPWPRKSRPAASRPKVKLTKLFIDNKWVDPVDGGEFETYNPATGEVIAKVAAAGAADVDKAVKAARRALESGPWSTMDAADRGRLLFKLADLVEQNADELAALESLNCGKTISDSKGDMEGVVQHAALLRRLGRQDRGPDDPGPRQLPLVHAAAAGRRGRPDHPLELPAPDAGLEVGPGPGVRQHDRDEAGRADAADGPARSPSSPARRASRPGVINIVNGMGETTGAALVAHPDVDKIAFTGHVDTAKIIQKAAADTLKRTTFELGGKSPNVIFADADLDAAVAGAFHAIYFHGGQCCTAGSRLFVEIEDPRRIRRAARREGQGPRRRRPARSQDRARARRSRRSSSTRSSTTSTSARSKARPLITGGERVGDKGFFVQPTIFDNVKDDMAIARDEIFGPVVSVLPFQGLDEVIERANKTNYGLAAAIWTKDIDKAHLYAKKVKAGTVWVNCYHVVDTTTPFGGFKMSGQGRENGEAALEHYTELKTVTIKLG